MEKTISTTDAKRRFLRLPEGRQEWSNISKRLVFKCGFGVPCAVKHADDFDAV